MKQFTRLIATISLSFIIFSAYAEVRLPAVIADNMVLQQQDNDPIWGWASPGESITVKGSWANAVAAKTKVDDHGNWMLKIKTPKAGGPYTLTISGTNTITLHNILIGEVWICSGQSNMEMPVQGWGDGAPVLNSKEEINNANYPDIRLFTVKKDIALVPQQDCNGSWSACSPASVANFSATAYFFGRALYQKLKVPIGLIHTSWGGTPAEAWTSRNALKKLGDFNNYLKKLDSLQPHLAQVQKNYEQQVANWRANSNKVNEKYAQQNYNDANWKPMQLPAYWESAGLPDYDGIVWFRKEIDIPASWAGKNLKLDLGTIDDMDMTWFNGKKVGEIQTEGQWQTLRSYTVPADLVKAGKNIIAVRVTDLQGGGGIYGEKKLMHLYPENSSPENGISLAGNWKYNAVSEIPKPVIAFDQNSSTALYNGMIAPLIPFAMRGVVWYQGEANVGRADQYEKLFPLMINNWRNKWNEGNFPFYFVQIAPYKYGGDEISSAALRDAQRKTLSLANTGMAVTLDIGNNNNIHPANKEEVGRRLSLWALAKIYGEKNIVYSGPLYKSKEVKDNKIILSFTHADGGLIIKSDSTNGFEIAGQDGKFVAAKAEIQDDKVIVSSDKINNPAAVRYDWRDTAVAHLFNKAGLPASSFSTK